MSVPDGASPQPPAPSRPRVLSIAGTDPTGGAGHGADLKSFTVQGAYGMSVITSVVAQNTRGVRAVHDVGPEFLRQQLEAVSDDVDIDAVKIGMLATPENVAVVHAWLEKVRPPVVVLDPVMVATSGDRLLVPEAEEAIRRLVPLADVVTPNLPELGVLVERPTATTWEEALAQAKDVSRTTGTIVYAKGGHLDGKAPGESGLSPDALVDGEDVAVLDGPWVATRNTHGTGCSLSSGLAALRPQREDWLQTAREIKAWMTDSLRAADALQVGHGHGPIDHLHDRIPTTRPFGEVAWEQTRPIREAIDAMPFLAALADGTLVPEDFAFYIKQDDAYLQGYGRALARAAELAPTAEARAYFATAVRDTTAGEIELHGAWFDAHGFSRERAEPSRVTAAYLSRGFRLEGRIRHDAWSALTLRRMG